MQLNQPYDPRYNAKIYIPKLTEEQRSARATPVENLRGLRYRTQTPAAPANIPVPAESLPQPHVLPENAAPTEVPVPPQVPASDYIPSALEVVIAEFPEIFQQEESGTILDAHEVERCSVSTHCSADAHVEERAHHTETTAAKAPNPPAALAYEEDDILAYANVVSFYARPHRNTSAPKGTRQRSGGLRFSASLLPHHSSG